nr:metalloregulator ArsR/SmtB family transcription factor [Pseudoclavibacter sp. Marseille-Q3772]
MQDDELDRIFAALADPTRRMILSSLRARPATVTELVARSTLSQPAISKHLKVLEHAGLIRRERSGQRIHSALEPAPLLQALEFVSQFELNMSANHARLDSLLNRLNDDSDTSEGTR